MADVYTPSDGLNNIVSFPTTPANETAARLQVQSMFDQILAFHNTHMADTAPHAVAINIPHNTTGNITYYVRTDGNDSNNGSSNDSAHAFLTIGKAISIIPQIINHAVTINVAAGTYNETVNIIGFYGKGTFTVAGIATCSVNNISVYSCGMLIKLQTLNITTITSTGITAYTCSDLQISSCTITASAASQDGIRFDFSIGSAFGCTISNRNKAIHAVGSTFVSDLNGGTSNVIGLYSEYGSTLGKNSTQPSGSTAESSASGGVIR